MLGPWLILENLLQLLTLAFVTLQLPPLLFFIIKGPGLGKRVATLGESGLGLAILARIRAQAEGTCMQKGADNLARVCSLSLGTGSTLMIVTEYMSHGALDGFLRVSGLGPGG